ncbi:MAG TPA: flavin reductase, partial [Chitinophagaceae bacterium]|nr:flavin reductase [Chitinophagaceae bacterium]
MTELHLTSADLEDCERFFRANLINSITGYKPAMLIGTQNKVGHRNLAIFSSVVHLGADPALVGFIQRPVDVSGDTFRNIMAHNVYTINHVHEDFVEKAHYTSARFESGISEFEACKLTPYHIEGFDAPFVMESRVRLGMELVEVIPITHNNTRLVIGRIKHILLDQACLEDDGNINLGKLNSVAVSGLENYHLVQKLRSFPYAKVENLPDF